MRRSPMCLVIGLGHQQGHPMGRKYFLMCDLKVRQSNPEEILKVKKYCIMGLWQAKDIGTLAILWAKPELYKNLLIR